MNRDTMKLMLTIEQRSKHVPYPADFSHGQSQNHGFRTLKSDLGAIEAIPEVRDCPAFREALLAINGPDTPFFSVGCEKSLNRSKGMWSKKGYLEFAFNCADRIGDAAFSYLFSLQSVGSDERILVQAPGANMLGASTGLLREDCKVRFHMLRVDHDDTVFDCREV